MRPFEFACGLRQGGDTKPTITESDLGVPHYAWHLYSYQKRLHSRVKGQLDVASDKDKPESDGDTRNQEGLRLAFRVLEV